MSPVPATSLNSIGTLRLQPRQQPRVEWTSAPAPVALASLVPQVLARYGIECSTSASAELGAKIDLRG